MQQMQQMQMQQMQQMQMQQMQQGGYAGHPGAMPPQPPHPQSLQAQQAGQQQHQQGGGGGGGKKGKGQQSQQQAQQQGDPPPMTAIQKAEARAKAAAEQAEKQAAAKKEANRTKKAEKAAAEKAAAEQAAAEQAAAEAAEKAAAQKAAAELAAMEKAAMQKAAMESGSSSSHTSELGTAPPSKAVLGASKGKAVAYSDFAAEARALEQQGAEAAEREMATAAADAADAADEEAAAAMAAAVAAEAEEREAAEATAAAAAEAARLDALENQAVPPPSTDADAEFAKALELSLLAEAGGAPPPSLPKPPTGLPDGPLFDALRTPNLMADLPSSMVEALADPPPHHAAVWTAARIDDQYDSPLEQWSAEELEGAFAAVRRVEGRLGDERLPDADEAELQWLEAEHGKHRQLCARVGAQRARHTVRVGAWVDEWEARAWEREPGALAAPLPVPLKLMLCGLGAPPRWRWPLWQCALGIRVLPQLQEAQVKSLLSTPLPGAKTLESDVAAAVQATFFSSDEGFPLDAAPLLCEELLVVLTLLLKRARLAYRSELPLPSIAAPLLLLALRHVAADKADRRGAPAPPSGGEEPTMCRDDLIACRSDVFNAMLMLVKQLCPAVAAGRPWGVTPNGAASGPPNQPFLQVLWLQLQWLSPALLLHLQHGVGVSAQLMKKMLSFLSHAAPPRAFYRLVELALWEDPPAPSCHAGYLVVALLLQHEARLLGVPPDGLGAAVGELCVSDALEAERLHVRAKEICGTSPRWLQEAIGITSTSAPTQSLAMPYACCWLEPDEVLGSSLGGTSGKMWAVDLRSQHEFDMAHFALTLHVPPDALAKPEERERARHELLAICAESGCGLAFVTAGAPLTAAGCSGAPPELVAQMVTEFVRAGFARVGILRSGFAALTAAQRESLVMDDVVHSSAGPQSGVAKLRDEAAARLGAAKEALKTTLSFSRRSRTKALPIQPI
mmetsp:Transcript_39963/g.98957  ORF Transcript_39963/g.98957 Transcript_39963/m.98957 type:complete len:960 (-) Transcript_39963:466-3345(-)